MPVKVKNNIGAFVNETERKVYIVATKAMILVGSEASVLTPMDTSTLLNSQFHTVDRTSTGIRGRISYGNGNGYTANYAKYVHDPNVKQTFRRATAEKEFLLKGGRRAKPNIDAMVKRELKK